MAKLKWDQDTKRLYELGIDQVALFVKDSSGAYGTGVAWNGVTELSENPTGAEANKIYANNSQYLNIIGNEEFEFSLSAYTYPDEFNACDGVDSPSTLPGMMVHQQTRREFGLAYRTLIGNDTDGKDHGYKIHVIYNAVVSPSQRTHSTITDTIEPQTMSWDGKTTPEKMTGMHPVAHLEFDSTVVDDAKMTKLENKLFGTDASGSETLGTDPTLLKPDDLLAYILAT